MTKVHSQPITATPNPTGVGKYSKIIRGLHETIATMEAQCSRALTERDARIQELEAELAGCRACRAKVDCISRTGTEP